MAHAEFEGEMALRTYGIEFARATANAKADVVKGRLDELDERLTTLEQRKEALRETRGNGTISEGEFRARMAELAAQTGTVEHLANASEARAGSLPTDLLESKGINVSAIQTLKATAESLSGGETARFALSIAGPNVGQSVSQGPPAEIGTTAGPGAAGQAGVRENADGEAQAAIDRAESRLDAAEARLEQAEGAGQSERERERDRGPSAGPHGARTSPF